MSIFLVIGCSYDDSEETYSSDNGKGKGDGGGQLTEWDTTIKPIIADSCAISGCHAAAGFVKTEAAFRASASKIRITNNNMPVPGSKGADEFSAADKAAVLTFLNK